MPDSVAALPADPPSSVGLRLAAAREEQDLSIEDVAARTRIPRRHLEAIERGEGLGMPGTTYVIGFAKSYARAVGLDPNEIARECRAELGGGDHDRRAVAYAPADPSRVPPRLLAIAFVLLALLVAGGYTLWRSGAFGDDADLGDQLAAGTAEAGTASVASVGGVSPVRGPASAPGAVAVTAIEPVWVRIYEMSGTTLFQGELAAGRRFAIPAGAIDPRIRTGRPQALRVTVGDAVQPALGEPDRVIRDVRLTPDALAARAAPTTASAPPVAPAVSGLLPGQDPNALVRPSSNSVQRP